MKTQQIIIFSVNATLFLGNVIRSIIHEDMNSMAGWFCATIFAVISIIKTIQK